MLVDRYRFPDGNPDRRRPLPELRAWPDILAAHNAFADRESRRLFRALLIYRYVGPHASAVTHNCEIATALESFMTAECPSEPIGGAPSLLGEPVSRWQTEYNGQPMTVETIRYGLFWTEISDQYFLRRNGALVVPRAGDVVIDCGACMGDTALKIAAHVGPAGKVFSFDPWPFHAATARRVAERNGLAGTIETYCCGVSDRSHPNLDHALAREAERIETTIKPGHQIGSDEPTIAIDDFCRAKRLARLDYIKMDIEGSEPDALAGAYDSIARYRPKLAVCVYHKPADLWEIPLAIKRRFPFYRLYLGHYSLHGEETVLYCAPEA
jgi:FkbM family methyltransferase